MRGRTDSAGFDNLANSYSSTSGCADNTEYDFSILYRSTASVRYSGLTIEDTPTTPTTPIPEPQTYVPMALGLAAVWAAARRGAG